MYPYTKLRSIPGQKYSNRMKDNILFNLSSTRSDGFTSFAGPLFQYFIVKSIDRNTGLLRRWAVFSNGKRPTLVRFLFGKWLWDELKESEMNMFWHLSEITDDFTINSSFRARKFGISKKDIRKRLEQFNKLYSLEFFITRQQYLTLKGRGNWFFKEETVSLRKVPKYSGYTKHYKDKGTLGTQREYYLSENEESFVDVNKSSLLFEFLTVGTIGNFVWST